MCIDHAYLTIYYLRRKLTHQCASTIVGEVTPLSHWLEQHPSSRPIMSNFATRWNADACIRRAVYTPTGYTISVFGRAERVLSRPPRKDRGTGLKVVFRCYAFFTRANRAKQKASHRFEQIPEVDHIVGHLLVVREHFGLRSFHRQREHLNTDASKATTQLKTQPQHSWLNGQLSCKRLRAWGRNHVATSNQAVCPMYLLKESITAAADAQWTD